MEINIKALTTLAQHDQLSGADDDTVNTITQAYLFTPLTACQAITAAIVAGRLIQRNEMLAREAFVNDDLSDELWGSTNEKNNT